MGGERSLKSEYKIAVPLLKGGRNDRANLQ